MMADLIVLTFDNPHGAMRALTGVQALEELNYAWIDDVAVIEKHKAGFVTIHSPHGSPAAGAWFGGLVGLLLFWWFPPAWFFGGWLAGLGIGALAGEAMAKAGLDKGLVEEIKSELKPGSSALLLMGARGDVDEMSRAFEQYRPTRVLRYEIADDVVEKLKAALGSGSENDQTASASANT
jgi:uncharacterized membrane protein